MTRRLGPTARAYATGEAGRYRTRLVSSTQPERCLPSLAAAVAARMGAALVLGGAAATRFSVFKAGFQAAEDPRFVLETQRAALAMR